MESRQRIYMKLLGVKLTHFWISSGDMPMPEREIPPEMKDRYWAEAFGIIDELRGAGDLKEADAVVDALIGLRFEHEWQRAEAIEKVIHQLGQHVAPRVARALRRRDDETMTLMRRDADEWWRRRGKIEPIVPSPKEQERSREREDADDER